MADNNIFQSLANDLDKIINQYAQKTINGIKDNLIKDLTKTALAKESSGSSTTKLSVEAITTMTKQAGSLDTGAMAQNFKAAANTITEYSSALQKGASELAGLKSANDAAATSISKTDLTLKQTSASVQKASKASKLLSTAFSSIKGSLVESAINLGINLLVDGVGSLISHFHKSKEEIIQAGQAAKASMDAATSNFDSINTTVTNVKKNYAQLSQGVKQVGASISNVSLSTDEYNEFLNMNNQLASLFPELTTGYDSQGNAILNLSGNVDMINSALDNLIEKQRQLANEKVAAGLPEYFSQISVEAESIKDEADKLETDLANKIQKRDLDLKTYHRLSALFSNQTVQIKNSEGMEAIISQLTPLKEALADLGIDESLLKTETQIDYDTKVETTSLRLDNTAIPQETIDSYYNAIISANDSAVKNAEQKLANKQNELRAKWSNLNSSLATWLQTDDQYSALSNDIQSSIQAITNNLDWSKIGVNNLDEAKGYIKDNIYSLFTGQDGQKNTDEFTKMLDFQFSFKNGEQSIKSIRINIPIL